MKTATLATRRWWYIMPIVFITYSLAYLDRANYGFAAASGMAADLMITPGLSSMLGALFFLGYFFFQVPGAIYAQKHSVKKLIFVSLILWGSLATLTGIVSNAYWLIVIRFMLGVVEAAVMPAMLIYLCHWFTRAERSRANTFLILGNPVTMLWMSVVSGYLVQHYSWRWMFIVEGLPAVLWAFIWWRLADDRPSQAKWLNDQEKQDLESALAAEQVGIKAVKNYAEAFRSPKVIILALQFFCWSIGVYGFVLWLPSILKAGAQMDMVQAGWLSALPYLAAVIGMLLVSWGSDKLQKRKRFVWPPLLIASDLLWFLRLGCRTLLGVLHPAGDCRCLHVRALRTVLRNHSGDPPGQRRGRRHGADQQHGRPRFLWRFLSGRLPEQLHRLARRLVPVDERRADVLGAADHLPQARRQRSGAAHGHSNAHCHGTFLN